MTLGRQMNWMRFVIFVCVVTILQASVLNAFAVTELEIKPDLLLVLLVYFAIFSSRTEGIIASFSIGFAADLIPPGVVGSYTISFGVFGTLLAYFCRVINVKKMPYQGLVVFVTGLLTGILAHNLSLLKGPASASSVYAVIFWRSLYSGFVGPFLFLPSAWWMRIKTHRFG